MFVKKTFASIHRPSVEIIEVTIDAAGKRLLGPNAIPVTVNLGDSQINKNFEQLLRVFSQRPTKSFLLRWQGERIPTGAVVNGHTISWTKDGIVNSDKNQMVGVYHRLLDSRGGPTEKNEMLVQIFSDDLGNLD